MSLYNFHFALKNIIISLVTFEYNFLRGLNIFLYSEDG